MTIMTKPQARDQSLPERWVGIANDVCIFPGIEQCFAVLGFRHDCLICTHVTPGTTKDEMSETFDALAGLGGAEVLHWYILGPRGAHFGTSTALWTNDAAIKKTFKKQLKNKNASYLMLDSSAEARLPIPDIDRPGHTRQPRGIDIRAQDRGAGPSFSYRPMGFVNRQTRALHPWEQFDQGKFVTI